MLDIKKLYCVDCKNPDLTIDRDFFGHGPLPMLWYCQGMYKLIPVEIIANILQLLKPGDFGRLFWDQGISICTNIGDQLTNKQFDYDTERGEG